MSARHHKECPGRNPSGKELDIASSGYDHAELCTLEVARYFWQSFAAPETFSWLLAFEKSEAYFKTRANIGLRILSAVQAKRHSRVSCFRFNNPTCYACASLITEHERQFMEILRAVRTGRPGLAQTHAMLLCEGNATQMLIRRMRALAKGLGPRLTERQNTVSKAHMH